MKEVQAHDAEAKKRRDSYPGGGVFMISPTHDITAACDAMMAKLKAKRFAIKDWEYPTSGSDEKQVVQEKKAAAVQTAPVQESATTEASSEKPAVQKPAVVETAVASEAQAKSSVE
jgi:hypothetical protein